MMKHLTLARWLLLLLPTGCSATVGPYVTDVRVNDDRVLVRKCERRVNVFLGFVWGSGGDTPEDCQTERLDSEGDGEDTD